MTTPYTPTMKPQTTKTPSVYIPTTSPTPVFGQSGDSVKALQQSLNQKYAGVSGYTPLVVDGKYGPLTQQAVNFQPPQNNMITSSYYSKMNFLKNANQLSQLMNTGQIQDTISKIPTIGNDYKDQYTMSLDNLSQRSDDSTKRLISSIQAQRQMNQNAINDSYDRYKRGIQLLGIQGGEQSFAPDLLSGKILQAENAQQMKIQQLQTEELKAIMDADDARANNNFKLLQEKMDYIKQLRTERKDAIKDIYDQQINNYKIDEMERQRANDLVASYYDDYTSVPEANKANYIKSVSQNLGINPAYIVNSLALEKQAREERVIKSKLSGGSSGGSSIKYTNQELKKLRQAGIDPNNTEEADEFLYTSDTEKKTKFFNDIDQIIQSDQDDYVLDKDGFLTEQAFKELLQTTIEKGYSRKDFLNAVKPYLYLNKYKFAKNYGITEQEFKDLTK